MVFLLHKKKGNMYGLLSSKKSHITRMKKRKGDGFHFRFRYDDLGIGIQDILRAAFLTFLDER